MAFSALILGEFFAGGSSAVPGIDLGLDDPAAERLGTNVQFRCEVLAGSVDGLVAVQTIQDLGDGAALDFRGVLLGHVFHSLK